MSQVGFSLRDGALYCDALRVSSLLARGLETPFYLYSMRQLRQNLAAYQSATAGVEAVIGYAIKANHNLALCQALAAQGAGAVVVSAHELRHAQAAGFPAEKIWLHGNGKRAADLDAALSAGVLLSADSAFDLAHIQDTAARRGVVASLLLRVNPDIDPGVHPYISTGLRESKFGIPAEELLALAAQARALPNVLVRGLHCHLGSTLKQVRPFVDAASLVLDLALQLRAAGHPVDTVDLGGGLGIDYERSGAAALPSPAEMLAPILPRVREAGLRLLLEPGRSIVGNTGALITRVIGAKQNQDKRFLVVDASMAQLMRPCLYDAYHHIVALEPSEAAEARYDVVGPLCESGDFLGKDRPLRAPAEGDGIAVLDGGAYGFSMASRYNLHLFCAEYTVDGERVTCTRRAERYEDFAACFVAEPL